MALMPLTSEVRLSEFPPIVLVNGAWHGAWCWPLLQRELSARGALPAAVEVLGFGGLTGGSPWARYARPFDPAAFATERSTVADLTLSQVRERFLDDVRAVARGRRVSVVAHSISGFVVAAAAELAPELFSSVTYLAAIVPLVGLPAAAYNVEPEMGESLLISGLVGDPPSIGAARCDFWGDVDHTVEVFYGDAPPGLARQAVAMLAADVPFGINGAVEPTDHGIRSVPQAYIHTRQDRAVPMAMQERVVREIEQACGRRIPVRTLDTSHSPFLSQPAQLAEYIIELAGGGHPAH
jgi:pimeloyl-ACP methyl ester carboxylesterase